MLIQILVTALVSLTFLADLYTTKRAIVDNPTRFHEGNPMMAATFKRFGFAGLCVVKLVVLAPLIFVVWYFQRWAVYGPALAAAAGTGYVAWRNKRLLIKARK